MTKLMFTILNGGKSVSSKVKFSKIYLILGAAKGISIIDTFLKIQKAITTTITSSKVGLNGFKQGADGSFFNACENINEALKMIEDAINGAGCNSDQQMVASVGINCESDSFYNPDQNKYDMEGPKNLFDPNQMSDWYIKLLKDHPLISYIEDPFSELDGYRNFPKKLADAGLAQSVNFGLKTFYHGKMDKLKSLTEFFEKEEDEGEGEVSIHQYNIQTEDHNQANTDDEPKKEETKEAEEAKQVEDPNKDKFYINTLHVTREQCLYFSDILEFLSYGNSQKAERKFGVIIQDQFYESTQSDIVDLAIGIGAKYLNIKGIGRTEKIAKVLRYSQVTNKLLKKIPEEEPIDDEGNRAEEEQ